MGQKLDVPKKKESTGTVSAMAKFRTLDKQAQSADDSAADAGVKTTHQNAITWEHFSAVLVAMIILLPRLHSVQTKLGLSMGPVEFCDLAFEFCLGQVKFFVEGNLNKLLIEVHPVGRKIF